MTHTHLVALDDPAKPWRRVWKSERGVYVKTWAKPHPASTFGRAMLELSGSECDARGDALPIREAIADEDGAVVTPAAYAVHPDVHQFHVTCEEGLTPEAREAILREAFEAALQALVGRVEAAALAYRLSF